MNRPVENDHSFELTERYELIRTVGRGLMGVVFEVLDRETGQAVAAKLLTHVQPVDPDRFRRVFEAVGRLDHPHLARPFQLIEHDSSDYFVEQFIDGSDLLTYLRQPPTSEELEALQNREAQAEEGLTDTDEIPPSGPIELDPDFDPETGETSGETPSAHAEDESEDSIELIPPTQKAESAGHTVELVDMIDEASMTGDEGSAAEIIEQIASESSEVQGQTLDLVLLRLERVLPQLVDALEHLHRFRKQHGNLKPTNILVDRSGRCLLTDYGLLQELELLDTDEPPTAVPVDDDEVSSDETVAGVVVAPGPPSEDALATAYAYRAPETLPLDEASPRGDLYALGCVLFEAISGRRPFDGSPEEIRQQQLESEPASLSEIEPHCPASWADLIHGLLDKQPARRPSLADVRDLVEYSESYAVGIPPSAVPEQEFFFGRSELVDDILAEAKHCYQRKRLGVSILRGPAGVGKTAISQAVSYMASRRGWLVLTGKCYNRESLIYQGWDEIAAQLANIFQELPEELRAKADACRRQASSLFPILRFEDDPPPRDISRLEAIDSFRNLLRRLSSQRPLLLLMDDLHWASWDTSALLLDLIGEPHGLRCTVLGTWLDDQADEHHPLLEWIDTAPASVRWLEVTGFSKDEAREYVISAGSHLSLQDQRRVLKRGEFNPLLLEELIHETRSAAPDDEESTAQQLVPDEGAPVTEKLTEVLESRIEALSRRERFVLEVLSVASIPLPGAIISTILDEEFHSAKSVENTARDSINRLLETRFIEAVESHHWDIAYTVSHNIYRSLILGKLRDQRYAHLCGRIADGVRRCWPAAEELRFEYLLRAGQNRDAADSAIRAASAAEARFAYNRAAKLWRWLSDHAGLTSLSPDTDPVAEHARLEFLAHRYADAASLYHEAAGNVEPSLRRATLLRQECEASVRAAYHPQAREALDRALSTVGENYFRGGLFSRLAEVKDRAVAATSRWSDDISEASVDAADDAESMRADIYRLALDMADLLDPAKVEPIRTRLAVLAEKTGDAQLMGLDRLFLAGHTSEQAPSRKHQRILQWLGDAATLFEQAADWEMRGLTEIAMANQYRLVGEFERSEERLVMAAKYFRSSAKSELRQRYLLKLKYADLLLAKGQLDDAEWVGRQLLHFWRADRYVAFRGYQILIPCFLCSGRTALVEHLLEQCRNLLDKTPTNAAKVWVERMSAQLNIALGRPEVAVGQLDVLTEQVHHSPMNRDRTTTTMIRLSLGQALAALAERELALITHRSTETLIRLKSVVGKLQSHRQSTPLATRAAIYRLVARYELLRGNAKRALRALDQSVDLLVAYDNPIEHAKCLEARGVIYRAMESFDGPALVDQAHAVYAHFGARLPLFIEGWPVPSRYSRLNKDED
ncbi:serine/threonine-protein kinase [Persicimonas caeni]|nr:serine/threonine-protein kinase [Persicimonas caeni]